MKINQSKVEPGTLIRQTAIRAGLVLSLLTCAGQIGKAQGNGGISIAPLGSGEAVSIELETQNEDNYVLETQATLMEGAEWAPLMEFRGSPGKPRTLLDPFCTDKDTRFYRLRQKLAQPPVEVSNFRLISQRGTAHELYYHWPSKAVIVYFVGAEIQHALDGAGALNAIREAYPQDDIQTFIVSLSSADERDALAEKTEAFPDRLPVLQDIHHAVTRSLSSGKTPEAILIDPKTWSVRYRGPIELTVTQQDVTIEMQPLKEAVADLLNERPPSISRLSLPDGENQVREIGEAQYATDIAPMLIRHCFPCHTPDDIAPWAMTEYSVIEEYSRLIKSAVLAGEMPPWHADPKYSAFANSKAMSADEISMLVDWIDRGSPRGDGSDPLADFQHEAPAAWPMGTPDAIVSIPVQSIPATGSVDYKYLMAGNPFGRDVWLRGVAVEPGNRSVVHHCLVFKGSFSELLALRGGLAGFFAGYVPGMEQEFFPDGTGKKLKAGDIIVFQMHYTVNGKAASDQTKLGLYLSDQPPAKELITSSAYETDFSIPPRSAGVPVSATRVFPKAATLYEFSPHMHYRGSSARYTLEFPDGTSRVILNVPAYFFDWQALYRLENPIEIPAGTILRCEGTFDNTIQNRYNPDPSDTVRFGEQSWEEMFIGYINYAE